jgi:hypothetical protein
LPLWCNPFHVHLRGDHERPKVQLLHLHPQRGCHVLELLPPIGCRRGRRRPNSPLYGPLRWVSGCDFTSMC